MIQHIKFPTHNLGHALDLISTEYNPRQQITFIPVIYVSDHMSKHERQEVKFRTITEEAINKLIGQFNNQPVPKATTLEDAVFHLNHQMLNVNITRSHGMMQTCMVREQYSRTEG